MMDRRMLEHLRWPGSLGFPAVIVLPALLAICLAEPLQAQDAGAGGDGSGDASGRTVDPPSLDDLLGIDGDTGADSAREATDQAVQQELRRQLSQEEIADAFTDAIEKMSLVAARLGDQFDPGLGTQRLQEEILDKLEQLINSAQNNQSQQQQQQQQQARQQQQQQDQQQQQQPDDADGDNAQAGDPPPFTDGDGTPLLDDGTGEWGNLPDRIRDMLVQGMRDQPSSLYRRLTEEYYRRLAEDSSP